MPKVQKEVERFTLRASERQLLELAVENRDLAVHEANTLYSMRTGAILVDHEMKPDTIGRFVRVNGSDIAFLERVEEDAAEEQGDSEQPEVTEEDLPETTTE